MYFNYLHQWLKWKIWIEGTPFSARAHKLQRGSPATRAGPISCWCEWIVDGIISFICLPFFNPYLRFIKHRLFCTDVCPSAVYSRSCGVPPTVLVHFTNLAVQDRYLPITRGAGTPFSCVPVHFNHWLAVSSREISTERAPTCWWRERGQHSASVGNRDAPLSPRHSYSCLQPTHIYAANSHTYYY